MKLKNYLYIFFFLLSLSLNAQHTYTGNGNSGFGGTVGGSSIDITNDELQVTFTFSRGAFALDSIAVLYIDSKSGGYTSTTNFTDDTSDYRKAISTRNGSLNPTVNFPEGFEADYAIAFDYRGAFLFELRENNTHVIRYNGSLSPFEDPDATTHSFKIIYSELDITEGERFDFIGIYSDQNSYVSNETIGSTSSIIPDSGGINPGYTGSITFDSYYTYPNVWTGAVDNDWNNAGNWTGGVPSSTVAERIYVPRVTNQPTLTVPVSVDQLTLASGASIITQSSFGGTVLFKRTLSIGQWYVISPPVSSESIDDMISVNDFAVGTGSNIGLSFFDNSQPVNSRWQYFEAGSTGTMNNGQGYAVMLSASHSGDFLIRGNFPTTDVSFTMANNTLSGGTSFNLVGNPYPSYLKANLNAGTNNILQLNAASLTQSTIWLWNSTDEVYETYNNASDGVLIAPGQGFFVSSSGSNTFNFTESMQTHSSSDTFMKNARPKIRVKLNQGEKNGHTDIYYIEGTTTGFDNGYDSTIFGGGGNSFGIFTELVSDSQAERLAIQSLPNNNYESMVIPIGIMSESGAVSFSAEVSNLPPGYKVYLEDRESSVFSQLDESGSKYDVTLTSAQDSIGRFFIHVSANALSTGFFDMTKISVYLSNNNNLKILGIQEGTTKVDIYTILGKQVFGDSIESKGVDNVPLPSLTPGIYIVKISTHLGLRTKKILIE